MVVRSAARTGFHRRPHRSVTASSVRAPLPAVPHAATWPAFSLGLVVCLQSLERLVVTQLHVLIGGVSEWMTPNSRPRCGSLGPTRLDERSRNPIPLELMDLHSGESVVRYGIVQNPSRGIKAAQEPLFDDLIESPRFPVAAHGDLHLLHPRSFKTPIDEQGGSKIRSRIVHDWPDTREPVILVVVENLLVLHELLEHQEIAGDPPLCVEPLKMISKAVLAACGPSGAPRRPQR